MGASIFPLACGHPSPPIERDHPVWDDPSIALLCDTCGIQRQPALIVQLDLYEVIFSPDD